MVPSLSHEVVQGSVAAWQRSASCQCTSGFYHDISIFVGRIKATFELCQGKRLEHQHFVLVVDGVDARMEVEWRDPRVSKSGVGEGVEEVDHEPDHAGILLLQVDLALLGLLEHAAACFLEELGVRDDKAAVDLELFALARDGEVGELLVFVKAW